MTCRTKSTMNAKWVIFILFSLCSVVVFSISITTWRNDDNNGSPRIPLVLTPGGKYVGRRKSYPGGSDVISYVGIPFALPPVGELRFQRPQPVPQEDPETVIQADQYKKSCISVTKKSTNRYYGEDCLYLNVYIPGKPNANTNSIPNRCRPALYSVMIWIHGGGFVAGSTFPEPIQLVTRGNVIVVTVNYRMGVFGFLTTNDDALPGNNGLWDQYMAVKWVKENIRHFGGDENSITVFGESAGAMSAHILSLSPLSSNLFHKVILQSGTANSLVTRNFLENAKHFAMMVGCPTYGSHFQLADCLRNVTVSEILENDLPQRFNLTLAREQIDFIWMPIIDGQIIPDDPTKLLGNSSYLEDIGAYDKDYMIGLLDNEGGLIPDNFLNPIPLSTLENRSFYNDFLDYAFEVKYGLQPNETSNLINIVNNFYFGTDSPSFPLPVQSVLDTASDAIFVSPSIQTALTMSVCNQSLPPLCLDPTAPVSSSDPSCENASASVFVYLFDYCPDRDPCQVPCMSHGSDVAFEFPQTTSTSIRDEFKIMSDLFIDILTTFAKTSNPKTVLKGDWPTFEPRDQYYLRLSPQPALRQKLYSYRTRLWLESIPTIIEDMSITI